MITSLSPARTWRTWVKTMANPFAYDEYRKDKIRQKIEESRVQRVQIKKLPKVNRELALKLMEEGDNEEELSARKKGKALPSILSDERFQVMFENPDYQVEEQSEEFRLLNPIVSKVGQKRRKKLRLLAKQATDAENAEADQEEEEPEGRGSSDESSDDDKSWVDEVREQRRLIYEEGRDRRRQERKQQDRNTTLLDQDSTQNHAQGRKQGQQPRFFQIKAGEEFRSFGDVARKQKLQKASLEERLKLEERSGTVNVADTAVGSKQLTFTLKKSEQQQRQQQAERDHHEERKKLRRSAGHLSSERGRGRGRGRGGFRGRGGSRGGFRGRGGSRGREHY